MSDENKVWEFKDFTKITTSSSESKSMDYLYTPTPENRRRFPHNLEDPFGYPDGSVGIEILRKSLYSGYLA